MKKGNIPPKVMPGRGGQQSTVNNMPSKVINLTVSTDAENIDIYISVEIYIDPDDDCCSREAVCRACRVEVD